MASFSIHAPTPTVSLSPHKGRRRNRLFTRETAVRRPRLRRSSTNRINAQVAAPEEGLLERPRWVGETPLSRFVGALISFKPFFALMKLAARQVIINTAEKSNVPWRQMTKEILESDVYEEMAKVRNPNLVYPNYYLKPFHAYDEGNLSWLAAAEAEAATMSIARRALPDVSSIEEANNILRGNWLAAVEKHVKQYSGNSTVSDILDIGCSIGVSTRYLASKFPEAKLVGLDLSPYFLAVAQYKENKKSPDSRKITWIHANGESTGLPSNSFDLVSIGYVFHECPARATRNILKEAYRLLRNGGTIAITDNSPKSKIVQELPPVLFTLMKSTEPFLDEYYLLDLDGTIREVGFKNVVSVFTDPRHRTVTGTVQKYSLFQWWHFSILSTTFFLLFDVQAQLQHPVNSSSKRTRFCWYSLGFGLSGSDPRDFVSPTTSQTCPVEAGISSIPKSLADHAIEAPRCAAKPPDHRSSPPRPIRHP